MKILTTLILLFGISGTVLSQQNIPDDVNLGPEQYLMSPDEAIGEIFGDSHTTVTDTVALTSAQRQNISEDLHRSLADTHYTVHKIYSNDDLRGYAMVVNEYGKYRPITILVGIDTKFRVEGVRILVYRENRGGEVQRKRFLYQYRNKSSNDPIRINRDIINISGATISVRGVNAGVRKVLHLVESFYGDTPK